MTKTQALHLFEERKIRALWDDITEKWYFSVIDVVGVLTDQPSLERSKKYWSVLKVRLKKEGFQPTTNCSQLKMKAADGKMRMTDVADTEPLLSNGDQDIPLPLLSEDE